MRLSEFKGLAHKEQLDLLRSEGVYIGKRKMNGRCLLLFQLEYFYVEITYEVYRVQIMNMHYTTSVEILDAYLDQVTIYSGASGWDKWSTT